MLNDSWGLTYMALTTTVSGVWTLQALLGVETMPAVLRIKPFVPSVHDSLIVETTAGPLPLAETGEYLGLVAAGVINTSGAVDDVVRDWMTVLGRPERQVPASPTRYQLCMSGCWWCAGTGDGWRWPPGTATR
jgi:EspG family